MKIRLNRCINEVEKQLTDEYPSDHVIKIPGELPDDDFLVKMIRQRRQAV